MSYRAKLLVFVLGLLGLLFVADTVRSAFDTISKLDEVEAERDGWQRPSDLIRALDLKSGDVAVDLGCGAGYLTLKLSSAVGPNGKVIAEDIRRLSLTFLWFRTILKRESNISIVRGETDDPHLPTGQANAVLILNTYHELSNPQAILTHVRQALVSGGRLVVADRAPSGDNIGADAAAGHEIPALLVEDGLRQANFEIVSRQDRFIEQDPDRQAWWLIVARKP